MFFGETRNFSLFLVFFFWCETGLNRDFIRRDFIRREVTGFHNIQISNLIPGHHGLSFLLDSMICQSDLCKNDRS
jgi:hypothetical protein